MKPILLLYAFSSLSSASLSPDFSLNLHALAPRADDILRIADHFLPKRADEESMYMQRGIDDCQLARDHY